MKLTRYLPLFFLLVFTTHGCSDKRSFSEQDLDLSAIPSITLDLNHESLKLDNKITVTAKIDDSPSFSAKLKFRGQTSKKFPKKQFSLKIQGEDQSIQLLGMTLQRKLVLNGPFLDKSMMRNWIAFKISELVASDRGRRTLTARHVNLFIKRNNDVQPQFHGIYVLMEAPFAFKQDSILFAFDKINEKDETLDIKNFGKIELKSHDKESFRNRDASHFQSNLSKIGTAIKNQNLDNIDVPSFVDNMLMQELTNDVDSYFISTYFQYLQSNERLSFGPSWDFNLAFGLNLDRSYRSDIEGWRFNSSPAIFRDLISIPAFYIKLSQRWCFLRQYLLSNDNINSILTNQSDKIRKSAIEDHRLWHEDKYSYDLEVQKVTNRMRERFSWMDKELCSRAF